MERYSFAKTNIITITATSHTTDERMKAVNHKAIIGHFQSFFTLLNINENILFTNVVFWNAKPIANINIMKNNKNEANDVVVSFNEDVNHNNGSKTTHNNTVTHIGIALLETKITIDINSHIAVIQFADIGHILGQIFANKIINKLIIR
jgi:hypothetical protein